MKIDINKLEFKKINENISLIYHDNKTLRFWTPLILVPFGIDNEYNKYLLKLEIDDKIDEHVHLKKIILHIENLIKKKLDISDLEFKSVIKYRENNNDLIEPRLKSIKNNITTIIDFEDKENNYLKTIFDIKKQNYYKVQLEINGFWDYRNEKKERNKSGLIVYVTKIIVPK